MIHPALCLIDSLFEQNWPEYDNIKEMSRRFLFTLLTLVIIFSAAAVAIFLAKGYTFSSKEKGLVGTGIISVTSIPDAASVYVDGHLTTATNANIASLQPKEYDVRVIKEGFIPWEKKVKVREGLVTDLKITLFPAIPTIYPLTFNGVKNPVLSPDAEKLAYIVPSGSAGGGVNKKAGVWVWTLEDNRPIAFARGAEPHQVAKNDVIDFVEAALRWSPDSKQLLVTVGSGSFLLQDDQLNTEPRDITPMLQSTLKSWEEETRVTQQARLLNIKNMTLRNTASSAATLKWSPDETKFLHGEKEGKLKVYNLEDQKEYEMPEARSYSWLPDSRHIVLVEEDKISVAEFDGSNKAIIYAGKFEDNFVFAWPDSSRLVMISSFPTPTASEPNLYGINLK